jgi:predicted RNA-binding Zn ribbon-like protein
MTFDSHVLNLVSVAARLVNHLTSGESGGRTVTAPEGRQRRTAAAEALGGEGRPTPAVSTKDAAALADAASGMRRVFESAVAGHVMDAAFVVNELMSKAGARPQLDPLPEGGWHVHFHGMDDTLATGWTAGCATGLALAIGSNLAGRLGICEADRCDRVYVDTSRNSSKRFCSVACQNRTKAAAFRARQ